MKVLKWILLGVTLAVTPAYGKDAGQWEDNPPEVREWFKSLKMADNPTASCCGEADGYWCDELHVVDGKTYCTIDDDRDDERLGRPHVPIGFKVLIPPNKLGYYPGNPTGHNIVFMAREAMQDGNQEVIVNYNVYCYVQGGGI